MNEPKIPPLPEPHAANESGSTVCTVCWFIETDAGWIGSYNKEALDQLNRRDHQWQEALQAALEHNTELKQQIADWTRRSESCESKLGQLEAWERIIELERVLGVARGSLIAAGDTLVIAGYHGVSIRAALSAIDAVLAKKEGV